MTGQTQQDIDSGAGEVVTDGQPVQHRDMEDGQSVGHTAEPEHQEGSKGNERPEGSPPTADDMVPDRPPPRVSRDDIYSKAKHSRDSESQEALEAMTPEQRANYDRMVLEASGEGEDPFSEQTPTYGEGPDTKPQGQKQPNQPPQQAQTPPQGIDQPGEMTTITVYGMREDVPTADVEAAGGLAAYQKQRAADIRLQRLSTYEATLRNWEDQLSQRAEHVAQPPAGEGAGKSEPSPTDVPAGVDVNALAESLTDAVYSGDREEAQAKFRDAFASIQEDARRAAQQNLTQTQQPSQGPSQQDVDRQRAMDEANAVFRNEFRDLNTQVLKSAALNMVNEVAKDPVMIGRPLSEITREACERVREDVYGSRTPPPGYEVQAQAEGTAPAAPLHTAPAGQPPTDLAGRHQLKRRTVVTPLSEAHGTAPVPQGDAGQFPSNSEWVATLRKGRGLPTS